MMVGSPGIAFTWQLWSRVRVPVLAVTLYLTLLTTLAHLPGATERRDSVLIATVFLGFGLLFVLGVYALPGKDVLGTQSGYPDWMLVLPVRTRELVFWPMVHACGAALLAWIVPTQLILRPLGVEPPLLWPGVMIAAMTAWLQAILWVPCGLPYLRLVLLLVLLPGMVIGGIHAGLAGTPSSLLAGSFAALIPAAFGVAVWGVGAARRGDEPEWRWTVPRPGFPTLAARASRSFPSAETAQLWYEWRSSGLALPLAMTAICVLSSLPFLWVHELLPIGMNPPRSEFGNMEVNVWLRMQASFLLWPPLLGALFGCGRRRYDTSRRDSSLHPFLATRPVREGLFVGAKLRAAAGSTILTWIVALAFYFGWLLTPGRAGELAAPSLVLLWRYANRETALLLAIVLAILVFWTWKNQVQGLFADVSGRRWLIGGAPAVLHSLVLIGYGAWIEWCGRPRDVDLRFVPVPDAWGWVLGLALLAKFALSVVVVRELMRRTSVSAPRIVLWLAAWCAAVAGLAVGLHWVAHTGRYSGEMAAFLAESYLPLCAGGAPDELVSWRYLLVLAALFVPFARLVLAPLALHWNRHR